MSNFLSGLIGAVIGGALGLLGVHLTLKKQLERDRKDDERRLRDRRYDRLREAFSQVVVVAESTAQNAYLLGILHLEARRTGNYETFLASVKQGGGDTSRARAILLLEPDVDKALYDRFRQLFMLHMALLNELLGAMSKEPDDDTYNAYETAAKKVAAEAEDLARVARARLAELDRPID